MTVYLDRRFRGVGRIKRAAGTDHKPTIRRLNEMLTGLFDRGRLDVLRSIQKGEYTPLQVWAFYSLGELHKLPTAATMGELEASMKAWINDRECSEAHRRSLYQSLRHLIGAGSKNATIADLPELLKLLRPKMKAAKHPRSFNLAKAAAQAFVKSKLTKANPLYFEVMAVESLRVTPQRAKHPLTIPELIDLTEKMPQPLGGMAWTMAVTGMGPNEFWGSWDADYKRVVIHGTKRKGRERIVPSTTPLWGCLGSYKAFRLALHDASDGQVRPYDLRRTYANLLEAAGIPRTRRKLYMGHGASDVTDLYERHEVARFLEEDGERLRRLIGATETRVLKLEKRA